MFRGDFVLISGRVRKSSKILGVSKSAGVHTTWDLPIAQDDDSVVSPELLGVSKGFSLG